MHQPRKRFGQHFLTDPGVLDQIVSAIAPRPTDRVVEIGPGLGALTLPLLSRLPSLTAIEIDRDLIARWQHHPLIPRLNLIEGDALAFDFSSLEGPYRLVGNLPYNISTPLLFRIANIPSGSLIDAHFLLQKEVVDRMVAQPAEPAYGRLSVMLQYHFRLTRLFEVGAESFSPPPKVESAVVRLTPLPLQQRVQCRPESLERVVGQAFSQRRKMLRSSLRPLIGAADLITLGIDPERRAETLSLQEFATIATALGDMKAGDSYGAQARH